VIERSPETFLHLVADVAAKYVSREVSFLASLVVVEKISIATRTPCRSLNRSDRVLNWYV